MAIKPIIQTSTTERFIVSINQTISILQRLLLLRTAKKMKKNGLGIINPIKSFIYAFLSRELVKIRKQNKGKLNFRSVDEIQPNFNVRCDVSANGKRPSRIYLKNNGKLQIPTIGDVRFGSARSDSTFLVRNKLQTSL